MTWGSFFIADAVRPVRRAGFVIEIDRGVLTCYAADGRARHRLNPTAALLWQLSDGARTAADLRTEVTGRFGRDESIRRDVDDALTDLASRELVAISPDPRHSKAPPILRVGFTGFPDDFCHHANSFVTLLARRVLPWVVDPRSEQADILFIATSSPIDDAVHVRQPNALRVVVDADGEHRFTADCNVYIGTGEPPGKTEAHWPADPREWLSAERRDWPSDARTAALLRLILGDGQAKAPRAGGGADRPPKLTVGMAFYDDFDGVYFTVQALRLFHPEVANDIEILVIDNHPQSPAGNAVRQLTGWVPTMRYLPCSEFNGTAVRDYVFRYARGDAVLCIDSHVMIEPGALARLIDFFEAHPDCRDLLQGPLVYDDLSTVSTHCDPVWRGGMFGTWGCDPRGVDRDAEPFEIPLQGLGLFACRRDAWLGFNPSFRGFGGEEGYIHEKYRQAGHRTLCLPFLRWLHRFGRPQGQEYANLWDDRMRNYLLGCEELGLDSQPVEDHFEAHIGPQLVDHVRKSWVIERDNPFRFFDVIYCINLDRQTGRWEGVSRRFAALGIEKRIRRFSAIETADNHHVGCLLSHRAIVEFAQRAGFENVLVFEDDVIFHDAALHYLRRAVAELRDVPWRFFYLGGATWNKEYPKVPGCRFLDQPRSGPTTTHAIAYHRTGYDFLLSELPKDAESAKAWLDKNVGIDQFLASKPGRVVISPMIASQPSLIRYADEFQRQRLSP